MPSLLMSASLEHLSTSRISYVRFVPLRIGIWCASKVPSYTMLKHIDEEIVKSHDLDS